VALEAPSALLAVCGAPGRLPEVRLHELMMLVHILKHGMA